jgi:hypothetical protein
MAQGESHDTDVRPLWNFIWRLHVDDPDGDEIRAKYDKIFRIIGGGDAQKGFRLLREHQCQLWKEDNPMLPGNLLAFWARLSKQQKLQFETTVAEFGIEELRALEQAELEDEFPRKLPILQEILDEIERGWQIKRFPHEQGPDLHCVFTIRRAYDNPDDTPSKEVEGSQAQVWIDPLLFARDRRAELTEKLNEVIDNAARLTERLW